MYKSICHFFTSLILTFGCNNKKPFEETQNKLVHNSEGHKFLALWKSEYYPPYERKLSEEWVLKTFGSLEIDSSNAEKIVNVKFGLRDSIFHLIAAKEKIIYHPTYFLDTTSKDRITNFEKASKSLKLRMVQLISNLK